MSAFLAPDGVDDEELTQCLNSGVCASRRQSARQALLKSVAAAEQELLASTTSSVAMMVAAREARDAAEWEDKSRKRLRAATNHARKRWAKKARAVRDKDAQAIRWWRKALRKLDSGGSAWAAETLPVQQQFYRLSRFQTSDGRRCLLRLNYRGQSYSALANDTHAETSAGNDASDLNLEAPVETLSQNKLLRQLSSASFEQPSPHPDEDDWSYDAKQPAGGPVQDPAAQVQGSPKKLPAATSEQTQVTAALAEDEVATKFSTSCVMVRPMLLVPGTLRITNTHLCFEPLPSGEELDPRAGKLRRWALATIVEVQKRRYLLRQTALEIFFDTSPPVMLDFDLHVRSKVIRLLKSLNLPELHTVGSSSLHQGTIAWQKGQMSNFDYLMLLNSVAGRTYNDLTQYPVFPWVLADFQSDTIDLKDPTVYRDLSKPMGALNPERLARYRERFEACDAIGMPPFMYGTHYSSVGSVLFYLLRLEPFSTFSADLQGGRFDHSDRLFFDITTTWYHVTHDMGDVKELIPEFYYQPDFLVNSNALPLGVKQDGVAVDDVLLPKWVAMAPGSNGRRTGLAAASEFVRINREALESEVVSKSLHKWIDLIFGCKQRGKAAQAVDNLFFHLTYEGNVDWSEQDPLLRQSLETQIANFGQCPTQLFTEAHPPRSTVPTSLFVPLWRRPAGLRSPPPAVEFTVASRLVPSLKDDGISVAVVLLADMSSLLLHSRGIIMSLPPARASAPGVKRVAYTVPATTEFALLPAIPTMDIGSGARNQARALHTPFVVLRPPQHASALGNYLVWASPLRACAMDIASLLTGSVEHLNIGHSDVALCMAVSDNGRVLVSGGSNGTVLVWSVCWPSSRALKLGTTIAGTMVTATVSSVAHFLGGLGMLSQGNVSNALHSVSPSLDGPKYLLGHSAPVRAAALDHAASVCVTITERQGLVHHVSSRRFVNRLVLAPVFEGHAMAHVVVSRAGDRVAIVSHDPVDAALHLYTINGQILRSCTLDAHAVWLGASPNFHWLVVVYDSHVVAKPVEDLAASVVLMRLPPTCADSFTHASFSPCYTRFQAVTGGGSVFSAVLS